MSTNLHPVRRREPVMGTVISIDVHDALPASKIDAALEAAFRWLRWVDETFSTYRPHSQISRLGRGEVPVGQCHPAVGEVLELADQLRRATNGYFDVCATPGGLDPSGLVKGWSVQRASEGLAARGLANHCINAGGDVALRGHPGGPGTRWQVGIVHPLHPGALSTVVALSDGAVATSGTYQRGLHVFDPHTGLAAADLASVTIVGPNLTLADSYATAALAMGRQATVWLAELHGYESYVIDTGGFAWWSPGFARYQLALPGPGPEAN